MSNPFRNYDAWLERPYQDAIEASERYVAYWESIESRVLETIRKDMLQNCPERLRSQMEHDITIGLSCLPGQNEATDEDLLEWARSVDDTIPSYDDWEARQ